MLPIPSFLAPASVCARALNALLSREQWAREHLGRHAGKTVRFAFGEMAAGFAVASDGYVSPGDPAVVPDVTLTVPAARLRELPGALRANDPERIAALMHIEGDAALARVVSDLARDLRWDAEDDLARIFGDVAAGRLMGAFKGLASGVGQGASRLAGNIGEYLVEEQAVLPGRGDYDQWRAGIGALNARLDALEARLAGAGRAAGRRAGGR